MESFLFKFKALPELEMSNTKTLPCPFALVNLPWEQNFNKYYIKLQNIINIFQNIL